MDSKELKSLASLIETADAIEDVLSSHAHGQNPFACRWNDSDITRSAHFDDKLSKEWHAAKVKLAKKFLVMIRKQISINKKKLGMR